MPPKWSAITLIELVEKHPCLWDKSAVSYKMKTKRQESWNEVFRGLEENFDNLSEEDQSERGSIAITKWNNIRDAFVRSLKQKNEKGKPKRKYIYHENLWFLMKNFDKHNGFELSKNSVDCVDRTFDNDTTEFEPTLKKIKIKKDESEYIETNSCKRFEKRSEQTENRMTSPYFKKSDEDELFFASILPAVRKFSEEDKFDFRISVMKLIQDIRKRKSSKQDVMEIHIPDILELS